jgi:hypothetical protein
VDLISEASILVGSADILQLCTETIVVGSDRTFIWIPRFARKLRGVRTNERGAGASEQFSVSEIASFRQLTFGLPVIQEPLRMDS